MNDHSAGGSRDTDGDDEVSRQRAFVERQFMDRARRAVDFDHQERPRRLLQQAIALVAALGLVLIITLGFDAFLTSMQKVMRMMDAEEERQRQEAAAPRPEDPMPAYVVPAD